MKKLYKLTFLLIALVWATNLMATDYEVYGSDPEINGIYSPDGTNMYNVPRWKHSSGIFYLHSDGNGNWAINYLAEELMSAYYVNWNQSPFNPNIPPFTGWQWDGSGLNLPPTVREAGPGLSYSSGTFTESSANDGTIDNNQPVVITHNNLGGGTFTGTNGDNFMESGKVIVVNLPSGLTAVITRTSPTTLSATITGKVTANANANDVSNLTFAFPDAAFSTGDASAVNQAAKNDLTINFIQFYTVAISGGDFTTIAAAIAAAGKGDNIDIAVGTFTEGELIIDKNLTIHGQGADVTIIQAAATYNTATHRVFTVNSGATATIKNVTIRHGKELVNFGGGGINNSGNLTLQNVDVCYNVTRISGGGIINSGVLVINNSTIHHNQATYGAGISLYYNATITNSTITENSATFNTSSNYGGGIYFCHTLVLTNSTITKNTCINTTPAQGPSSGLRMDYYNGGELTISNTILSGNETSDYFTDQNFILHDNGNNIVGYQGGSDANQYFTSLTNILFNRMADKTVSTSWNRNNADLANQNLNLSATLEDNGTLNGTHTLALLDGSFAIDAGLSSGAPATDQRGYSRNGATDIGAYEYCLAPSIGSQSPAAQTQCLGGTFTPIPVTVTGDGLSYQWFYNISNSNSGGFTLNSANGARTISYTPQASVAGTLYYYCVVSGTCGTATSAVSGAFVTSVPGGSITISSGASSPSSDWSIDGGILTACADVTVNVGDITTALVAGNLKVQATNNIIIDGAIAPALTTARTLTLKAGGDISMLASSSIAPATEFALNTIIWSDSDANGGAVLINNFASITTKGGHLWIGGGSGSAAWNSLSVGNGYALGNSAQLMGIYISKATLNTSGGNLALWGKSYSSTGTGSPVGIAIGTDASTAGGSTISTTAGSIYLNGISQLGGGGIETGYNGGTSSLQTTTGNIDLIGNSSQSSGIALKSLLTFASTSGGNITITGTSSGTNQNGIYMENATRVLASGGTITLTGTGTGTGKDVILSRAGGATPVIGYAASGAVTASACNITINANTLSLHIYSRLQSSGILTIQPRTPIDIGVGGGAGTLQLPSTCFSTNFTDGFSKIIIGSTGTSYINISGTTTYNDDLTFKCALSIFFAESVFPSLTSLGSDLTLWSRSGGG